MPRRARIGSAGDPVHAIPGGIDRAAIFFSEADYRGFLATFGALADTESVRVHASVLMTNHVHRLTTPATDRGPARLMKGLGERDVQYVNRTDRPSGTLFEGHFRSSLIEAGRYLMACQRDVELNPVRARRVPAPEGCA